MASVVPYAKGYLTARQSASVAWMVMREGGGGEGEGGGAAPYGGILAEEVGAGKTRMVAALLRSHELSPTLIVVPKSLLYQWIAELHAGGHRSFAVLSGRKACATRDLRRADLVLASLSCFATDSGAPGPVAALAWGRVVVDEAHLIKNPRTRTHRSLAALRSHARWALTATPVQNCRADLLALARFVGVRGDDADLVRDCFMRMGGAAAADAGADAAGADAAGAGAVRDPEPERERELPPLTVRNVRLALRNEWEAEVCREAHADVAATAASDETAAATGSMSVGAMERVLRCRQASTHLALYFGSLARTARCRDGARRRGGGGDGGEGDDDDDDDDDDGAEGNRVEEALENAQLAERARAMPAAQVSTKIGWLVADVLRVSGAGEKSVVFCEWREEMRLVVDALEAAGLPCVEFHGGLTIDERDEALAAFRRRGGKSTRMDAPVALVAQIRCAACGLNIQCASRVYLMRPQWNPAVERQAIGRVHRRGQTRPVVAVRLVAEGTVDESCLRRQQQKLECITDVLRDDSMQRTLVGEEDCHGVGDGEEDGDDHGMSAALGALSLS